MTSDEIREARDKAFQMLEAARIAVRPEERETIEVTDLGLGDFGNVGLMVLVYVNTGRYCAKELIMLPRQICPEHRHPPVDAGNPGKQETFRCRWGEIYLYVAGGPAAEPRAVVPPEHLPHLNVWHEVVLRPGDQYTLPPDALHWFQAGETGAVVSEFSSTSTDENDVFTDPRVTRVPADG